MENQMAGSTMMAKFSVLIQCQSTMLPFTSRKIEMNKAIANSFFKDVKFFITFDKVCTGNSLMRISSVKRSGSLPVSV